MTSLFSNDLVSPKVLETLPEGYTCRALQRGDYKLGHLDVLRGLTHVGEITEREWIERFDALKESNGTYYVAVLVQKDGDVEKRIVGTGTLVVEKKFLYKLGVQGHIEDIAIAEDQQGKRLGLNLLQFLGHIAEKTGCYKTILDCSPAKEGFYVKCGYEKAGLEMHCYYDAEAQKHRV
ncbi:acyl-CoA N-acyltransferase [Leptodontidium sp. 2 PMI_412]|nr:acetyltransferase [Leptodontidium sp. MPI-SDFR-AT-0119]KAH9217147.1 acyl-CoA N-acyltransferase [Leptodontidium sp. 2 PMI_412]